VRLGKATYIATALATFGMFLLLASSAFADTMATVNATFVAPGGTVTGTFTFSPTTVTSWDLTASGGTLGTENFNSADTSSLPTFTPLNNPNGDQVLSFEQFFGTLRDELDLVVACGGVANCLFASTGAVTLSLVTGSSCPSGGFCSDELFGVPETTNGRNIALGTISAAGSGGGGGTPMPEPCSLVLLGTGLLGVVGFHRRLRNVVE
jgi:hypothetical protein